MVKLGLTGPLRWQKQQVCSRPANDELQPNLCLERIVKIKLVSKLRLLGARDRSSRAHAAAGDGN